MLFPRNKLDSDIGGNGIKSAVGKAGEDTAEGKMIVVGGDGGDKVA